MSFPWTKTGRFERLFGIAPVDVRDPNARIFNSRCALQKIGRWQDRLGKNLGTMTDSLVKTSSLEPMTDKELSQNRRDYITARYSVRSYQKLIAKAKKLAKAMGLDLSDLDVYADYGKTPDKTPEMKR